MLKHTLAALTGALAIHVVANGSAPTSSPPRAFDLGVEVPPGSPLDWTRALPARTPGRGAMFPRTPGGALAENETPRTSSEPPPSALDVRLMSPFAAVRILTWDLTSYFEWTRQPLNEHERLLGLPTPGPACKWIGIAPLLRVMLHPQAVSKAATEAHLLELGEPMLGILDGAEREAPLADIAKSLRDRIGAGQPGRPEPMRASTPRARMRMRFVLDELTRTYPYDPEGDFGSRLFLFGEEFQPDVLAHAMSENAFVRRNAVLALGRFETSTALQAMSTIAGGTDDFVVLARACGALGRTELRPDVSSLVARLGRAEDKVEQVILAGALGRIGNRQAADALLHIAQEAYRWQDPDLLEVALAGLCGIRPLPNADAVDSLAGLVVEIRRDPEPWRINAPAPRRAPDVADPTDLRPRTLATLGLILRVRIHPLDAGLANQLLALLHLQRPDQATWLRPGQYANYPFTAIPPSLRFLFIDTLSMLGERGLQELRVLADDTELEPALRGFAISRLPWREKLDRSVSLLTDEDARPNEPFELRLQAFEILADSNVPERFAAFHALVAECAEMPHGGGVPARRYLYRRAVQELSESGELEAAEVIPLLVHPKSARYSRRELPRLVRERIERAVQSATARLSRTEREELGASLVDYVIAERVNPSIHPEVRDDAVDRVADHLSPVRRRRDDTAFKQGVVEALSNYLIGFTLPAVNYAVGEFDAPVPLEEEILLALGRTREPAAIESLLGFLRDAPRSRFLPVAALAIGVAGERTVAGSLLPLLTDEQPFARYCAWRSLEHLTPHRGEELFADWLYGDLVDIEAAAAAWNERMGG